MKKGKVEEAYIYTERKGEEKEGGGHLLPERKGPIAKEAVRQRKDRGNHKVISYPPKRKAKEQKKRRGGGRFN